MKKIFATCLAIILTCSCITACEERDDDRDDRDDDDKSSAFTIDFQLNAEDDSSAEDEDKEDSEDDNYTPDTDDSEEEDEQDDAEQDEDDDVFSSEDEDDSSQNGITEDIGTDEMDEIDETDIPDVDSLVNTGKVMNIWTYNSEFKSRFEDYYWDNRDQSLWDGVSINWIEVDNINGAYQNELDQAIVNQNDADYDDKIDIFLVDADYALKYINTDITLDVRNEIGITDNDMKNQYKYTHDIATDSNGVLKGLAWEANSGAFVYNAAYARDVLGTDDPTEVQEYVKNWDSFEETAAHMKQAGVAMVSGYDDTYKVFANNVSAPWVTNGTVTIDPAILEWVEQTEIFTTAGYNNGSTLWDGIWANGMKIDGKTFGYFLPSWGIPYLLAINTLDDMDGAYTPGNGGYGEWRVCEGPQSYFWGGTWICGAYGSDNVAIIRDIMLKLTCDTEIMKQMTLLDDGGIFANNKQAVDELTNEGFENDFLGGQNQLVVYSKNAEKLNLEGKISAYDTLCNEKFQTNMLAYFKGDVSYTKALEEFEDDITELYNLSIDR